MGGVFVMGRIIGKTDSFAFKVSQDLFEDYAQFIVRIDGRQIGETQTVDGSASIAEDKWEDMTVTGCFGPGPHVLEVQFLNDAWGGPGGGDRNMYVKDAVFNDVRMGATSSGELYYPNQIASFSTQAAPSPTPSPTPTPTPSPTPTPTPTQKIGVSLWAYDESLGEVLSATNNIASDWGFSSLVVDAHLDNPQRDFALGELAAQKGVELIWLMYRGGPDLDKISMSLLSHSMQKVETWVNIVKTTTSTKGYMIVDEGSNWDGPDKKRMEKFRAVVDKLKSADPAHPTINVSNAAWWSGGNASAGDRSYSRRWLNYADVDMFSIRADKATAKAMCAEFASLTDKKLGVFLPSWYVAGKPQEMAAQQMIVDDALAGHEINERYQYLSCWSYKDFNQPTQWVTIGQDAVLKDRVLGALAEVKARW
ncbi:MAG: carbohydrate-binding domain-containing protein [Anaerolineae bacterium]